MSEAGKLSATESDQTGTQIETSNQLQPLKIGGAYNPFRLSRSELQQIALVQMGVRIRPSYSKIMEGMKSLNSALTFEEILDDALSFYFAYSREGREAVKKAETMSS